MFAGNQPSTTIILPRLDPFHLGMLLALYELVFDARGGVWGYQFLRPVGVELGKQLAGRCCPPSRSESLFEVSINPPVRLLSGVRKGDF